MKPFSFTKNLLVFCLIVNEFETNGWQFEWNVPLKNVILNIMQESCDVITVILSCLKLNVV